MRNIILGVLVLALVGGGVAAYLHTQSNTPEAKRLQLAQEFLTVLPDSLGDAHRREIITLFEKLWARYDLGLVAQADVDTIMTSMQGFIDAGTISGTDLVYYMAQVGYKTYAGEERFRLPSGMVDHPVLNPKSAMVNLRPDTTGFADWLVDRKRQEQAEPDNDADAP